MKRKGDYITLSKNAKRLMIENENDDISKYDVQIGESTKKTMNINMADWYSFMI